MRFSRISSPQSLSKLLRVELQELEKLSAAGNKNYRQYLDRKTGRWIEAPKTRPKKIQRRIHDLLVREERPDFLHSGFSGACAVSNAKRHLPNASKPFLKLDLKKFYPSSDGRRVYELFHNRFSCRAEVPSILYTLCTISNTKNAKKSHLPTGGVTSPILAYFCYEDLFKAINNLAMEKGVIFSLLADDLTFSGDLSPSLLGPVLQLLEDGGLTSNHKKMKVLPSKFPNRIVTGCLVTPSGLRVPIQTKKKISTLKEELKLETRPYERAKIWQRYHGSLSSAGQIEPSYSNGARCAMLEWKRDKEAWSAHMNMSAARLRC